MDISVWLQSLGLNRAGHGSRGNVPQSLLAPAVFLYAYRNASLSSSLMSAVLHQENGSASFYPGTRIWP